ncbi:hemerythrin domain-containing protein [Kitasatospora sp. NPDC015120]|uniref:hemerythrin domain-containing protein n=1 Tax=Kitasatospora sp. NPDC015120 TaxID=3364023 RepID=UPI0036F47DF0
MHRDADLLEELTADHRAVLTHFSEMKGLPLGDPARGELAAVIIDQLVRHTAAEERHLYPLARERLADGPQVVARELADHRGVEALLEELRLTDAGSPRFDRLMALVIEEVTGHAGDEEARLFPALRAVATPAELRDLGDRARETKARSTGRPRHQPPAARPADHLPPPERSLGERLRAFLTPGAPG